jgi:20S proteasome subunit beta 5
MLTRQANGRFFCFAALLVAKSRTEISLKQQRRRADHQQNKLEMEAIASKYAQKSNILGSIGYDDETMKQDFATGVDLPLAPSIAMPPIAHPTEFLRAHTDDSKNPDCKIKIAHGTTTLAFRFQGGIVVAVDSRATAGNWIASQTVKKVIEINPFLLGTMAGGAADCQFWETWLGSQCRLHELREKQRISVAAASKILGNLVYQYKGMGLSMGTMVCGYTKKEGPTIYYVDSDGTRLKGDVFCVGSGQTFAYGVLDTNLRWDLTVEEALYLGKRSILAAAHRDAYSGGSINLYHITENGWVFHGNHDVGPTFYEIKEKEGSFNNVVG